MQRDIEFRGLSRDSNTFVYGIPSFGSGGTLNRIAGWICGDNGHEFTEYGVKDVLPETIGQYIERKDKNGKKIYDGDIIKHERGQLSIIEYSINDCGWVARGVKYLNWKTVFDTTVDEVIGNIHQNYELLK